MDVINGTLREFVHTVTGVPSGFVMDGGLEVHFPPSRARDVAPLLLLGARLEISGDLRQGASGEPHINASSISNLDLERSVDFKRTPPRGPGELPRKATPRAEAVPLVPTTFAASLLSEPPEGTEDLPQTSNSEPCSKLSPSCCARRNAESGLASDAHSRTAAQRDAAAHALELAYDGFQRTQALVAFLAILEFHEQALGPMLLEAKHTYEQAYANYRNGDFAVASEFAAASGELLRSVESVISRIFRSDPRYPRLVAAPANETADSDAASRVQGELSRVSALLRRIHWLIDNGTMPQEDREQVRKIAAWGDLFHEQGCRLLRSGATLEASCLAMAAEAVARSSEHVCKQDYIAHTPASRPGPEPVSSRA